MALGDVPTALDLIPGINTTHLPAEQIHAHVMSRQLVHQLRNTATGRRSRLLADLARRMNVI